MNGAYMIVLYLNSNKRIKVGRLGKIYFKKGFYFYVGSAIGKTKIEKRCERHLKKNKKLRWHIDYLRKESSIVKIVAFESKKKIECEITKKILRIADSYVEKFGSSDCKCVSHLFYFRNKKSLSKLSVVFSRFDYSTKQIFKVKIT
jgi:sugar fermentation stimulation protein A